MRVNGWKGTNKQLKDMKLAKSKAIKKAKRNRIKRSQENLDEKLMAKWIELLGISKRDARFRLKELEIKSELNFKNIK